MADDGKQNGVALETKLDKKGRQTASTTLSSTGSVDEMYVGPNQAIPVILVPGIMGSPLIATGNNVGTWAKQGKWAWFPDDDSWMLGYGKLSYIQRRHLVDPAKARALEVPSDADEEALKKFCNGKLMPLEEAKRRGWGSVMITSYGGILEFLENQLQFIFFRGHIYPGTHVALPHDEKQWGEVKGYQRLTDDELRNAAAWRFPVYAVGYNWVDSNMNAATYLKRRVDEIRKDCRERLNLRCDKVILVTHSMGGLVARKYAKDNESDVLGIVHGVQPAIGAGTAYARVRGGWESNAWMAFKDDVKTTVPPVSVVTAPLAAAKARIGAWALGETAAEVMSVFANGAGPLELLPNHLYGSDWLKAEYEEPGLLGNTNAIFSLPKSDPYKEIYEQRNKWWRLMHPGALVKDTEIGDPEKINAAWADYVKKIGQAKEFHTKLGTYYHPNTFAHCGVDSGRKGWHCVTWTLTPMMDMGTGVWSRQPSPDAARDICTLSSDGLNGNCVIHNAASAGQAVYMRDGKGTGGYYGGDSYRAALSGHEDPGDATVPGHSGLAARPAAKFFAKMEGFEHQGSYENEAVRGVALYSVLRIAATAKPLS